MEEDVLYPAFTRKTKMLYEAACRVAINTKAQGTAAEIMKRGMIALIKHLRRKNWVQNWLFKSTMNLSFQFRIELKETEKIVQDVLEHVVKWDDVPLKVSTHVGSNWQEVTK